MPTSKLFLTVGLTVLLAALCGASVKRWNEPPREETAREELARLQSLRYREWMPPEQ